MNFDKKEIIVLVAAIACILYIYCVPVTNIFAPIQIVKCPEYELPNFLESRTDSMCTAIGILLAKATKHTDCIIVTNSWWPADKNPVTKQMALKYAEGY